MKFIRYHENNNSLAIGGRRNRIVFFFDDGERFKLLLIRIQNSNGIIWEKWFD